MPEASVGHLHPVSRVQDELVSIFQKLGFSVASGPELEDGFHNFDALNVPQDHPSRDMQDTFWVKNPAPGAELLRTHTSNVQVRFMRGLVEKCRADGVEVPAFRVVAPGKVFRNEATDRTHEAQFHQLEGLCVGPDVSLANLKWTLAQFAEGLFGAGTEVRLRPAFFPFVEPGVEVDASCAACRGAGCATCKGTGWVEILGAGMVHPKVLSAVGIDPRRYQGFAFGMGVDRIAMMRYGVDDVRHFYSGDLRVVDQF